MLPSLFISHGSPMLILSDTPARHFLAGYGNDLPRPDAIVIVSAHYETRQPAVLGVAAPPMIYDFGGFDPKLRQIVYAAPGDPALARRVAGLLADADLPATVDTRWGYDHGTWVPLALMYPDADIPVVAVSVQPHQNARHHFELGRALAPLRADNILVVGSGSLTHNLGAIRTQLGRNPVEAQAPYAAENHPTDEHLMPLYAAMGAAGPTGQGARVHSSHEYGALMMDTYAFT